MFIDEVKVHARAGHGGRGCIAFRREKHRPKGGPSGGNGGRGGNIVLQADHDLNNLIAQYYNPHLVAEDGEHGLGKGMDGHAGKDLIVKVPCGTLVWKLSSRSTAPRSDQLTESTRTDLPIPVHGRPLLLTASGARAGKADWSMAAEKHTPDREPSMRAVLLADLQAHGQEFVLCRGGRGGLGNRNFATARRQAPRFAQPGEPGEEGEFLLELRIIADVGLVGYPNAGKSTLLSVISKARPKIAPYPFTTLHPQIGIVEYPDHRRLTVCDVPGLIAGAHRNVGLGHAFLRHVQRCKILILMIDMAAMEGREPWDDYRELLNELRLYDPALLKKPRYVVANKMDEAAAETNLRKFKRHVPRTPVLPIAAAFNQGVERFKRLIHRAVEEVEVHTTARL
jgi:GTP-binding protein